MSDFWIFGQFFKNENCHNSRTSHDIDMKRGPVTKLDKGNTINVKKVDDNIMLENCDVIVFLLICRQFAAMRKPYFGRIVYKIYIFINNNFLFYRT